MNAHAVLFVIAPNWKELQHPTEHWEWTNQKYSDYINFTNVMLRKESQTEKHILYSSIYMKLKKRQNQSVLFEVKILSANARGKRQSGKRTWKRFWYASMFCSWYYQLTRYVHYVKNSSSYTYIIFIFFCMHAVHH